MQSNRAGNNPGPHATPFIFAIGYTDHHASHHDQANDYTNDMNPDKTPTPNANALTVDEARDAILNLVSVTDETETVHITDSVDRISALDVFASHQIPPFRNSAMDGYAIRFDDFAHHENFNVIGQSFAGHPFTGPMDAGSAVKITTGAKLPDDADTIIIRENSKIVDEKLTISSPPRKQQHVRYPGDDIGLNTSIVSKLQRLKPSDCGLLAAQGIESVQVTRRARVGIFSTGDELRNPGQELAEGQIYDSNRVTIKALLQRIGIVADDLGIADDSPGHLQQMLNGLESYDFILSSGGVSVGDADFVKEVVSQQGELLFWKVAMKPGKPMVTAKLNSGAMYFGLPGNPVSSLVTCVQFVIPALRAFSGEKYTPPLQVKAVCTTELKKEKGRFEFQRGWLDMNEDKQLVVATTGLQDSHVLSSMSLANCFICLPQYSSGTAIGEIVDVLPFDSLPGL